MNPYQTFDVRGAEPKRSLMTMECGGVLAICVVGVKDKLNPFIEKTYEGGNVYDQNL